jgi:hypothetical protein
MRILKFDVINNPYRKFRTWKLIPLKIQKIGVMKTYVNVGVYNGITICCIILEVYMNFVLRLKPIMQSRKGNVSGYSFIEHCDSRQIVCTRGDPKITGTDLLRVRAF